MGIVCSRVCEAEYRSGSRQGRRHHVPATCHWQKHFTVEIECFCVPSDRLLPRDLGITGRAEGCRTVVVTTVNIERLTVGTPQQKVSALNSIVYTPVLQWFGIDVRHQVPQYLPMNLWPGSYTVFGFYKPEEAGPAYVTLTAKIGNEDVYIEENMNTKRSLSAEQWSHLSRSLEKELVKSPTETFTERGGVTEDKVIEKEGVQRSSQDTGYMSRRITPGNQSPYSVRYDQTSDSEDAGCREQQLKEKRLRMKRKDTPAFSMLPFQPSHGKNRLRESPLTEEVDLPKSPASSVTIRRSVSSTDLDNVTNVKVQVESNRSILLTPTLLKASKSYQDISDIPPSPDQQMYSPTQEPTGKPATYRKKKRSIACKIADDKTGASSPAKLEEKKYDHSNVGSEADDEDDSTYTGPDRQAKQMKLQEDVHTGDEASVLSRCDPVESSTVSDKQCLDKVIGQVVDVKDTSTISDKQHFVKEKKRADDNKDTSNVPDKQYSVRVKSQSDDVKDTITVSEKLNIEKEKVDNVKDSNTTVNKCKTTASMGKFMQSDLGSKVKDETKVESPKVVEDSSNIGIKCTEQSNEPQAQESEQKDAVNIEQKSAEILEHLAQDDCVFESETVKQTRPNVRRKSKERAETPISTSRPTSSTSSRFMRRSVSKHSYKEISESEEEEFRKKHESMSYTSRSAYSQSAQRKTGSKRNKGYLDEPITPPLRKKEAFSDTN